METTLIRELAQFGFAAVVAGFLLWQSVNRERVMLRELRQQTVLLARIAERLKLVHTDDSEAK